MELFQKIESLVGLKMETYQAEQEAVLLLLERVGEAQRIATMQMKEGDNKGRKGKRKGGGGGEDDDAHHGQQRGGGQHAGGGGGGGDGGFKRKAGGGR